MARVLCGMLGMAALFAGPGAAAAEVRGVVELGAGRTGPVSAALLPLDAQSLPQRASRVHVVRVRGQGFEPPYLIVQAGDRLRFVNDDAVYHILVAPYGAQALRTKLGKADSPTAQAGVRLKHTGSVYVFCEIHHRSYLRVDVLDTSLMQMLGPDRRFEFSNVPPGRWRLRVAARTGEPVERVITAFTAPPPVTVTLPPVPDGVPGAVPDRGARVEALFPTDTGRQP